MCVKKCVPTIDFLNCAINGLNNIILLNEDTNEYDEYTEDILNIIYAEAFVV